ncbi:methylated-DNA--[protein]-cysteine S-methyltransferase [Cupriavidus sp. CV2]|uniref:methylated-DNA--[protein]-cysteine S-methyltransferase n=1 Tax=Cupriavidus ulmosensis TaxID=3065913 RepID=UPI00296B3D10|nr:methylated-DNA--[protein]-cysteine S-methyltransferase [Cupriavidus sp. CV2]MDW3680149.1 methylated-DNA--[protein]-cysteine S-methyltransferase [Cupriavidus sp. CV2]
MDSIFDAILQAPFGKIGVRTDGEFVREIVYLPESMRLVEPANAVTQRLARQLEAYYADPDARFDIPLAPVGSAFQRRVWQAISNVPRGKVTTYGEVARQIASAPRAVGQACGANFFPLVIPCHRVVGASGIGGFANHDDDGFYLDIKRWLLRHEGVMLT